MQLQNCSMVGVVNFVFAFGTMNDAIITLTLALFTFNVLVIQPISIAYIHNRKIEMPLKFKVMPSNISNQSTGKMSYFG